MTDLSTDTQRPEANTPNAQKMVLWHHQPAQSRLELTLPLDAGTSLVAETLASLSCCGWVLLTTYPVFVAEGRWA